jgi:hypothetical protein
MAKNAKIERKQKLFIAALKKKFSEDDPNATKTTSHIKSVDAHITLIPYKNHIFESMDEFITSLVMTDE